MKGGNMEPNNGKPLFGPYSPIKETSQTNGSHVVTLNPDLGLLENPIRLSEFISTEYHLTATIPNSQLSLRDLSLLLDVLNYQIVNFGANFSMMLALSELYLRCSGGQVPEKINDGRIRQTVTVSNILLSSLRGQDYSLYQGEFIKVDSKIKELLVPYLMSKRTYGSRFRTWRPEKLIRIRAVPVSTLIERTPRQSERYSGYTKGYGESHGNAHRKKTKPSFELDGLDVPDKEERNLILRMTDQIHQNSNQLWIKFKSLFGRD
jgi:hypothetical protein